ncbi:hypothetical protein GM418_26470 [Maribellus comscasis]|uniref:Uncharacterized protein n=1 Tax=Maribellus comscasis TaxID=2681766 RepID=A0A6I6K3E0_9BACT|nr:hypothetical protein [Maribellus comscasis]QGY47077.1 hypothetical protein GM418_26470 [Maribellus comscasis]
MKAIILISSIFYILGLKIGNKIDIVKKANPVEKIITNCITPSKPAKSIQFEQKDIEKAQADSLKGGTTQQEDPVLNSK